MNKNPWLILILFAISLTGSSYLNLELSTPKNRIKSIIQTLDVSLLITFTRYDTDHDHGHQTDWVGRLGFKNILDLSDYCLVDLQNRFESSASNSTDSSQAFEGVRESLESLEPKRTPIEILNLYQSRLIEISQKFQFQLGPDQTAYIVYTSGTTGQPKPIKISNSNLLSFLFNYSTRFQRKNDGLTRVLQFASYSFDVSVMSIWDTLAHGSTVCMTTAESLKSDLIGSIIVLKCTTVDLTPTVLNFLLEHDLFKSTHNLPATQVRQIWSSRGFYLNHINTGAEPVSAEIRQQFLSRGVSVCVDYGPSETTVGVISSLTLEYHPESSFDDIGRPTGLNEVYILDHDAKLVPLGGVGEICIGGGQVAKGYAVTEDGNNLSDEKFIETKLDGINPIRLYRTGDLGKFLPIGSEGYGSICCLGRIDSQVKISGVRIELGEVEKKINQLAYQLLSLNGHRLRAVVSKWDGTHYRSTGLVCFIELTSELWNTLWEKRLIITPPRLDPSDVQVFVLSSNHDEWFNGLVTEIKTAISDELSGCSIPRYWIPVSRIPVNVNGKTDRRELNVLLENHFKRLQESSSESGLDQIGKIENIASQAWSIGLGRSEDPGLRFKGDDNFIKLGGDSIGMMRTIGVVRKHGIDVKFSTLSRATDFGSFLEVLKQSDGQKKLEKDLEPNGQPNQVPTKDYSPFCLVNRQEREIIMEHLTHVHSISQDEVEDVYPISPSQAGIISSTIQYDDEALDQDLGVYFSQAVYTIIQPNMSTGSIVRGMLRAIERHPTLRTLFVQPNSFNHVFQVVLNYSSHRIDKNIEIVQVKDEVEYQAKVDDYLKEDRERRKFKWGRLSASIRIFECVESKRRRIVWSLHHALSDGWTLEILMKELGRSCSQEEDFISIDKQRVKYGEYVQAWRNRSVQDLARIHQFWRNYLEGVERRSTGFITNQHRSVRWMSGRTKLDELKFKYGITPALVIRLMIASELFNSGLDGPDVVFGMVRSGREIELKNDEIAEEVVGCCASVLPIRTRFSDQKVRQMTLLEALLNERVIESEIIHYQMVHVGELGRLMTGHGDWLDTLLTIQNWDDDHQNRPIKQPPDSIKMPTRFKLSIEVTMGAESITPIDMNDNDDSAGILIDVFYDGREPFRSRGREDHRTCQTKRVGLIERFLDRLIPSFDRFLSNLEQTVEMILDPVRLMEIEKNPKSCQPIVEANHLNRTSIHPHDLRDEGLWKVDSAREINDQPSLNNHSDLDQEICVSSRTSSDLNGMMMEDSSSAAKASSGSRSSDLDRTKIIKLKKIWTEVLGLGYHPFRFDQSFESLGGDSIAMMVLIKRIREEFYDPPAGESFRNPNRSSIRSMGFIKLNSLDPIDGGLTTRSCYPCSLDLDDHQPNKLKLRRIFRELKDGIRFMDLVKLL